MKITVRMKDGKTRNVTVLIPSTLENQKKSDFIDNWILDNIGHTDGWYIS